MDIPYAVKWTITFVTLIKLLTDVNFNEHDCDDHHHGYDYAHE